MICDLYIVQLLYSIYIIYTTYLLSILPTHITQKRMRILETHK